MRMFTRTSSRRTSCCTVSPATSSSCFPSFNPPRWYKWADDYNDVGKLYLWINICWFSTRARLFGGWRQPSCLPHSFSSSSLWTGRHRHRKASGHFWNQCQEAFLLPVLFGFLSSTGGAVNFKMVCILRSYDDVQAGSQWTSVWLVILLRFISSPSGDQHQPRQSASLLKQWTGVRWLWV